MIAGCSSDCKNNKNTMNVFVFIDKYHLDRDKYTEEGRNYVVTGILNYDNIVWELDAVDIEDSIIQTSQRGPDYFLVEEDCK